jgi:hypothetical protein
MGASDPGAATTARGPAEEGASTLIIMALPPERIPLADIRQDATINCRAKGADLETVADYAVAAKRGDRFPPVVLFRDPEGVLWLADGFHRCAAAKKNGAKDIEAEVRPGTRADALLFAVSANAEHGKPRTTADKRRALLALRALPEWKDKSARQLAERCKVSPTFASEVLKTVHGGQLPATKGKDGKVRKAKAPAAEPKAPDLGPVYVRIVTKHKRPADEHRQAFEAALATHAPPAAKPRRRIVKPQHAATAGGALDAEIEAFVRSVEDEPKVLAQLAEQQLDALQSIADGLPVVEG